MFRKSIFNISKLDLKFKELIIRLLLLLILFLVIFRYIFEFSTIKSNYLPVWSDEIFYYLNAFSFYSNNNLQAALTYNGYGAVILGSDSHGFMYPLVHGGLAKIFGWSNLNMIIFNFTCLLLSILLIYKTKYLNFKNKIFIIVVLLIYPFGFLYNFTFLQESIQILLSIILGREFYYITQSNENRVRHIISFLILIIFASLFRPTWFFLIVILIPIAKSKKEFIFFSCLFFISIFISFNFSKYFFEFVPNFFNYAVHILKQDGIFSFFDVFISHLFKNIKLYIFYSEGIVYYFMKMNIIFIFSAFIFLAFLKKSNVFLALAIFCFINIFFLMFFYDTFSWREIRFLTPCFYFSVFFIFGDEISDKIKVLYTIFILYFFIYAPIDNFKKNRNSFSISKIEKIRSELVDKIENKSSNSIVIMIDYLPMDYTFDLLALPVKNNKGKQIKYITNYYDAPKNQFNYILKRNFELISQ